MSKRKSRIWKIDVKEFQNIVNNSFSFSDIARHFGYSINSDVFEMIKERMEIDEIDLRTFQLNKEIQKREQLLSIQKRNKFPLDKILVKNSTYNRDLLKKRLLEEGLLIEKCYKCGLGPEWQGFPLTLQLEHKNGINDDNRLENLELLCPNCHSQTLTFAGRRHKIIKQCLQCGKKINKNSTHCQNCANKITGSKMLGSNNPSCKVKERPSRLELIELILTKPFLQIGKEFGVSDNAIRKWCKFYNLPYRKKDILNMKEELIELIS